MKQAVYALYSSDAVQQAQANQWLTSFQHTHDAWHVSFRLVAPDQPQELLFFAVTLLVRKVKADWGKLEPQTRQELNQAIRWDPHPAAGMSACGESCQPRLHPSNPVDKVQSLRPPRHCERRAKFQEVLSWPTVPPLVLRQLCLLLAAVVGSSGGEGANELVTQVCGRVGWRLKLGMKGWVGGELGSGGLPSWRTVLIIYNCGRPVAMTGPPVLSSSSATAPVALSWESRKQHNMHNKQ